ncbi:MAG: hypothetical protein ACYSWX_10620 [Planctomycetota bacterium]
MLDCSFPVAKGTANRNDLGANTLLFVAAIALTACGGTTGEEQPFVPDVPTGGDDLTFTPPAAGQTVGLLETVVPDATEFTLRGTLPLQPNVFGDASPNYTLSLVDADGNTVPTQVEVVGRFADDSLGADVVELIARMPRPAGAVTGERVQFEVVSVDNGAAVPSPASQSVAALEGTEAIPNSIQALLDNAQSITLDVNDVFGHSYFHQPLQEQHSPQVRRFGPLQSTVRTYGVMQPLNPVGGSNGTLDHHLGVHAYMSTLAEEEVLLLDLRFNNGPDGNKSGTTDDDPMGKLYFTHLNLTIPTGYSVVATFDDLAAGTPTVSGALTTVPLIAPLSGNKLHVSRNQAQFHRRLAIAPTSAVDRAEAILAQEGLAFARRGVDPDTGDDYYSWWNELTARYYTQKFPLPNLDSFGLENIRNGLANELAMIENYWDNGIATSNNQYPVQYPRLGYTHPWGVSYGGMTGGDEIVLWDGIRTMASASYEGIRLKLLTHRMSTDRHANVLYSSDGDPTSVNDWLGGSGDQQYIPMNLFGGTLVNGDDPFGFDVAPTFQVNAVSSQGRKPSYESDMLSFQPHLMSHMIRYTRLCKTLIYSMNDQMSHDDLRMQAEQMQLSYSPHFNNPWGGYINTGMRADKVFTTNYPNNGFSYGRQEGWAGDTMASYFAIAPVDWREDYRYWFREYVDTINAGQIPCSGLIYAEVNYKILAGTQRGAQAFETSICDNALRGITESVFRDEDTAYFSLTRDILRDYYDGFIGDIAWHATLPGPANMYILAPADDTQPAYCTAGQVPAGGQEELTNTYQTLSTLGFAYRQTGDPTFLDRAQEVFGGDLFAEMMADGTQNVQNRAALLAAVQALNGAL